MAYFGLNYASFCFDKVRYLSDEEKIKAVFEYQNNRTNQLESEKNLLIWYSSVGWVTLCPS